MISRHILGAAALLAGLDLTRSEQAPAPHGPGRLLRDERERVGDIERGVREPTPEEWAALQVALPELGPMAPTRFPRIRELLDAKDRRLDAALHPTGRCTCAGEGTCEWCVMDQRREKREDRRLRRRGLVTTVDGVENDGAGGLPLSEVMNAELARKAGHRQARSKRKARRGW